MLYRKDDELINQFLLSVFDNDLCVVLLMLVSFFASFELDSESIQTRSKTHRLRFQNSSKSKFKPFL